MRLISDEVWVGGCIQTHSGTLTESSTDWLQAILLTAEVATEDSSLCPLPRLSSQLASICVITLLLCMAGVTLELQENIIHKKGEPDRNHCKRYLEDLGGKLKLMSFSLLQDKASGFAALRLNLWVSLLTAKPPATFIKSFWITRSLICKRREHLTHKFLFKLKPNN